jgi:hypothetical protein
MLNKDKDKLQELLELYSSKEVMRELSTIALELAGDCSDDGFKEKAKELVQFSVALDDLVSGRPFLV